jgi:hypothetical protein
MEKRIKKEIIILGVTALMIVITMLSTMGLDFFQKDIQFHDTYFEPITFTILLIAPIVILVFLIRGIGQQFRNEGTNLILIVTFLLVSCMLTAVFNMYSDYKMDLGNSPKNEAQIEMINGKLIWTACEIITLIVVAGLLSIRTIRLIKRAS